jgi:WD40 repeat protein
LIAIVDALAFTPDGKALAAAEGGAIHLIDLESGRERFADFGHTLGVNQGAITADGRTVITAAAKLMVLWDARTGRELHRILGPEDCHTGFQLAPDGRTLVTCEHSQRTGKVQAVRLWDAATGKQLHAIAFAPESTHLTGLLAVSPDGQTLALHRHDGDVALLDSSTGRELRTLLGNGASVLGATFSPDGRTLLSMDRDGVIQFWNVAGGRKERTFTFPKDSHIWRVLGGRRGRGAGPAYSAQISSEGQVIAVTTIGSNTIELYHLRTGRLLHRVDALPGRVHAFAISPDGRTLAWSGLPERNVRLLEIATGRERHQLVARKVFARTLVFSADGKRLLSCHADTTAVLWDLTGRLAARGAWDRPLSARELHTRWTELAEADAVRAYEAIRRLAASPAEAVPYLAARLAPVPVADEKRRLRTLRALEVLERAGTAEAKRVLERLAQGAGEARLTLEAKAARQRLARLPSVVPGG